MTQVEPTPHYRKPIAGWTQPVIDDLSTGETLGRVHEHMTHFAGCQLCDWNGPDRDNEDAALADLADHLSDEHSYGEPSE